MRLLRAQTLCACPVRMTNAHNTCEMRTRAGVTLCPMGQWTSEKGEKGRRALNLAVSADLLEDARRVGVNLSALFERALTTELAELRRSHWRVDNAQAVSAYNEHLGLHGTCFEGRWGE